jgi:hypothetical protein
VPWKRCPDRAISFDGEGTKNEPLLFLGRAGTGTRTFLLDLHRDSMQAVASMGAEEALSLAELPPPEAVVVAARTGTTVAVAKPTPLTGGGHVPTFDYTHLGPAGAALLSGIVATEIRESVPELGARLSQDRDKAVRQSGYRSTSQAYWKRKFFRADTSVSCAASEVPALASPGGLPYRTRWPADTRQRAQSNCFEENI